MAHQRSVILAPLRQAKQQRENLINTKHGFVQKLKLNELESSDGSMPPHYRGQDHSIIRASFMTLICSAALTGTGKCRYDHVSALRSSETQLAPAATRSQR